MRPLVISGPTLRQVALTAAENRRLQEPFKPIHLFLLLLLCMTNTTGAAGNVWNRARYLSMQGPVYRFCLMNVAYFTIASQCACK